MIGVVTSPAMSSTILVPCHQHIDRCSLGSGQDQRVIRITYLDGWRLTRAGHHHAMPACPCFKRCQFVGQEIELGTCQYPLCFLDHILTD